MSSRSARSSAAIVWKSASSSNIPMNSSQGFSLEVGKGMTSILARRSRTKVWIPLMAASRVEAVK